MPSGPYSKYINQNNQTSRVFRDSGPAYFNTNDGILEIAQTTPAACVVYTPPIVDITGKVYTLQDGAGNAATYPITLTPIDPAKTINGAATYTISSNFGSVDFYYTGENFLIKTVSGGGGGGSGAPTVIPFTTTTKTLALTDANTIQDSNNASAQTITIPLNATVNFPNGTVIQIEQNGAGAVTVVGAGGVTLSGRAVTSAQYSTFYLRQESLNVWYAEGAGAGSGGSGTVTSVSVVTANGVSGSVATATTTPAITLTLGAITPSSVVATGVIQTTSTSANALAIGPNGTTNPVLNVDGSVTSAATGISIQGKAAGAGVAITVTSSGTNENLSLAGKGTGVVSFTGGGNIGIGPLGGTSVLTIPTGGTGGVVTASTPMIAYIGNTGAYISDCLIGDILIANIAGTSRVLFGNAGNAHSQMALSFGQIALTPNSNAGSSAPTLSFVGPATTAIGAGADAPDIYFNMGQTRQHATGAVTLQRDFRVTGSTHSFVGASTITDLAVMAIDGIGQAGTNATITNVHGFIIQTGAVAGTVTNANALTLNAPTGATNNYALNLASGSLVIKSGSNARIGTGTLSGGTLTVSNTSVTANTLVFLTDTTSGALTNVGSLTVTISAGVSFTVNSTNVLDTSTFNWVLIEKN